MNTTLRNLAGACGLGLALLVVGCGGGGSDAPRTTNPTGAAPTITANLAAQTTATLGSNVTLSVEATGTPAPEYQWRRNGQQILGQTSKSLSISNVQLTDDGSTFDVIVHNEAGNVTSAATTLHVQNLPGYFTVKFVTSQAGSLTGAAIQSVAAHNSAAPVTAVPGSGAAFLNWTGPNGFTSTDNPLTVTDVQSDLTFTANYSGGKAGCIAADISGIDSANASAKLSDYKGSVIVLDISAEWCAPCNNDAVPLEMFYQKYKAQGLKVVTVLSENSSHGITSLASLQAWAAKGLTFRVMNDTTGSTPGNGVAESVYVKITQGFPTFVVIDKNFTVQYIQGGFDEAAVEAKVKELLAK